MSQHVNAIALDRIVPGKNDRTIFEPNALRDLALSILEHGLLQPATVRPLPDGTYQIVAGERRWRAHKLAGKLLEKLDFLDWMWILRMARIKIKSVSP